MTVTNEAAQDGVLRLERYVAATPERVFRLWTDPDLLMRWWGPEGFSMLDHAHDIRPGGRWRTTMRSPAGAQYTVSGVYRVIETPRRLVFTWGWHDTGTDARGHETEVTVTFEASPGGTRIVVVQQAFESAENRDQHLHGWTSTLNKLERLAVAAADLHR